MAFYGSLGEVNFDNLDASITDTAVDVFVYDTSKDSDGGAWRKRTQNTSWYNETLGTATRGSRKEFPAVAVIVVETTEVTIYDGDDPDLPMWMVFPNYGYLTWASNSAPTLTSIHMLNGIFVTGASNGRSGLYADFIKDDTRYIYSSAYYNPGDRTIAGRTVSVSAVSGGSYIAGGDGFIVANNSINDVAMTVLPNAPVDSATGLPIPTIAVATDGGVSIIKDDGTVVDFNDSLGGTRPVSSVIIRGNDITTFNVYNGTVQHFFDALLTAADSTNDCKYNYTFNGGGGSTENITAILRDTTGINHIIENGKTFKDLYAANPDGLSIVHDGFDRAHSTNSFSIFDSRVAYIASDYNTGWMHGDIKGAFLSDTDATNLVATDLDIVTNGNFAADSDWTKGTGWTISGGTATHTGSGGDINQQIAVVSGKRYLMTVTVDLTGDTSIANTTLGFRTIGNGGYYVSKSNWTANAVNSVGLYWTSTVTGNILARCFSSDDVSLDNWVVQDVTDGNSDRSVNAKGLQVFGTITKSAVATGAELVEYSGFTSGNYLQQPYNSDLDFGTGDLSATFWFNGNSAGNTSLWERGAASGQNFGVLTVSGQLYLTGFGANQPIGSPHANAGDASWGHVVLLRQDGVWKAYLNGETTSWAYTNAANLTNTSAVLNIGGNVAQTSFANAKKIALFRISASVPSAEQVKKMYEDEKVLFQENAKATLYGSSDAVTALAYDEDTDLLHVGTSAGRSEFQGLRRINNTTDAVTTAISASNGLVAEQ